MHLFRRNREGVTVEDVDRMNGGVPDHDGVAMSDRPSAASAPPTPPPATSPPAPAEATEDAATTGSDDAFPLLRPHSERPVARRGFRVAFEEVSVEARACLRRPRPLLRRVSGYFFPGTIAVVVCADPRGARTLLEVLAGVEGRAGGAVMANALPVVSSAYRRRVALITSTDVCSRDATVRENLRFSARMRMVTPREDRIVRDAAAEAQLLDHLDTRTSRLGPAQLYQLALAMELVLDPLVVALDAPLRALPAGEAHALVAMLQSVAAGGRLVLVSATDVGRPLFEAAATIVLLGARGDMLYSGPRTGVEAFLREAAHTPHVSGDALGEVLAELDERGEAGRVATAFAGSATLERIRRQVAEHRKCIASNSFDPVPRAVAPTPNYFRQWFLLTVYMCRRSTIGHRGIVMAWSILFSLFFVMALLIAGSISDQNAMQNKRGVVFFLLSCSMQANTVLIDTEVREFFSGVHLRNNNYFDTTQFFTATVLRLVLPRVVFALVGALCTLFILESPFAIVFAMGLTSLAHASLIMLLVYWHPVEHHLWLMQNVYHGYCIILSGFLICLPTVPKFFPTLSLLRYGYGGVVASVLRDNPYSCDTNTTSYCYTGNQYLEMEGFSKDSWGKSALILFLISVVLLTLVAVSMKLVWVPLSQ